MHSLNISTARDDSTNSSYWGSDRRLQQPLAVSIPTGPLTIPAALVLSLLFLSQSLLLSHQKGDNLFSYRFSEVMGCGAIPVVYADDWMLPFGGALINWTNEAVVRIPENKTNLTKAILSRISLADRCQMRQRALELYRTYIATGRGTIRGIIENFESAAAA